MAAADLDESMRAIGLSARRTNLARCSVLTTAVRLAAAGRLTERDRRDTADVAHQLVGSAGTFGYPRASELAAELERFLILGNLHSAVEISAAQATVSTLARVLDGEES